jgi:UDP-glucose 4-epimerase
MVSSEMMKNVLVTGGAGFIGSHTVDLLLSKDLRVVVYDNFSAGKLSNLNVFHPNLRVVQADILDYANLSTEISKADAVLHLAALPSVPKSIEDPILSLKVNTLGFVNVLQAIRDAKKNIRLVYASSAAVYGDTAELPCSDSGVLSENTLSPYALEKANNERYADLFARLFAINSLGLRYFNVYGERQDPASPYSGVISKFISTYRNKQPITIFGDGKQSRDFIQVKDIARANWLALQSDYSGFLNVATGTPETLLNLVKYIEAAGGYSAETQFADARVGDIRESYASVEKARQHLNFQSSISLSEGIKQLDA